MIGIKESANLNTAIVFIKLSVVGIFICSGSAGFSSPPGAGLGQLASRSFRPPTGTATLAGKGIATGAASIFFAYIGFDAVSTAAQESKNPQKDMPIGILGSLVICTILYILVSTVLTGLVNYKSLNVADPVALGIDATGVSWGSLLVKIGAVFGLATVMLVMLLGQSRVFFSMSRDGLLPKWASAIHPTLPHAVDLHHCSGRCGGHFACLPARRPARRTGQHRHTAGLHHRLRGGMGAAGAPSGPAPALQDAAGSAGADPGHTHGSLPDEQPPAHYLERDDRLAAGRVGDLFRLLDPAQQGAGLSKAQEGD